MEAKEKHKLIFNLSPNAVLVNAIVLSILASLFWSLIFVGQFPSGMTILPDNFVAEDNVPWYCDRPLRVLSMILSLSWFEHKFNVNRNDISFRTFKFGYFYPIVSVFILNYIFKVVIIFFYLEIFTELN